MMNFSNLMMAKTVVSSEWRGATVNNNSIRVRVPAQAVRRKLQVLPSIVPKSVFPKTASSDQDAEFLLQNYANFKKSAEPARFMSYRNGSWVDVEKEVFGVLRLGFVEGKPVVEAQVGGQNCLFDFYRMLQIEFQSMNQRSIAWIDVNGKCFFPKVFVNSHEMGGFEEDSAGEEDDVKENVGVEIPMKIEIEIKIADNGESSKGFDSLEGNEANSSKMKRKNEEVSSSNFESKRRQILQSEEVRKPMWPKTRVLNEEEKGYPIVRNLFLSGLRAVDPGAKITAVHQCVKNGPMEKARYEVFQKQMELTKRARGDAKVVFAWYGTSAKAVETVLAHGFGMPNEFSGPKPYGVGVYLSPVRSPQNSAMLSEVDDHGEKHVVLCRVILGKSEKVEAGSQQSYPSSVDYDTGVDDLDNPKWYVVWCANMNTHIVPECVISYKPANCAAGQVNETSSVKLMPHGANPLFSKLYLKLGSQLPPPKVRELQLLCSSYKDGKLGKDTFMKQLRLVVGDEMLHATIKAIRG